MVVYKTPRFFFFVIIVAELAHMRSDTIAAYTFSR